MTAIWSEEVGDPSQPLVVLVHGSMDRAAGLLKLSRRLDDDYRVLRYDRRGYGRSTPHDGPFAMIEQVAALVTLLAGRRAVLIGHSYGGNVALAVAAHHPQLVAGVGVFESPLSWQPWWPKDTPGAKAVMEGEPPERAAESFMRRLIGDSRWDALPERTRATRRVEGKAMVGELADLRAKAPWHPEQIVAPVLVGYGDRGASHHREGMTRLASMLPEARLVVLPGCRHDAPTSHPAEFCHVLVEPLLEAAGTPWRAL